MSLTDKIRYHVLPNEFLKPNLKKNRNIIFKEKNFFLTEKLVFEQRSINSNIYLEHRLSHSHKRKFLVLIINSMSENHKKSKSVGN